eukprot:m.185498 g.185498  ORF g.185498 m.185498 type:complete len:330 (-) comp18117_c0_seq3:564-1553(-)
MCFKRGLDRALALDDTQGSGTVNARELNPVTGLDGVDHAVVHKRKHREGRLALGNVLWAFLDLHHLFVGKLAAVVHQAHAHLRIAVAAHLGLWWWWGGVRVLKFGKGIGTALIDSLSSRTFDAATVHFVGNAKLAQRALKVTFFGVWHDGRSADDHATDRHELINVCQGVGTDFGVELPHHRFFDGVEQANLNKGRGVVFRNVFLVQLVHHIIKHGNDFLWVANGLLIEGCVAAVQVFTIDIEKRVVLLNPGQVGNHRWVFWCVAHGVGECANKLLEFGHCFLNVDVCAPHNGAQQGTAIRRKRIAISRRVVGCLCSAWGKLATGTVAS